MSISYNYGVSFNCVVGRTLFDLGGGGEGCTSLDYVGNDVQKLFDHIKHDDVNNVDYQMSTEHEFVGHDCEVGDNIVAVVGTHIGDKEKEYIVAVIFENPTMPTVVE
jgi:hypothetical protein